MELRVVQHYIRWHNAYTQTDEVENTTYKLQYRVDSNSEWLDVPVVMIEDNNPDYPGFDPTNVVPFRHK